MTELSESTRSKPLWRRFYEMSEAEATAERAEDFRRLEAGEMSEAEATAEADALRRYGRARWPSSHTILDGG